MRDLAESEEVSELLLLDLDESRARQAVGPGEHGGGRRARAAASGWTPAGPGRSRSKACDVLVNSASYRVNLDAMRACLEAGCHYIDLGGLYWLTGDQLELGAEFETAGLLALLGMGSSRRARRTCWRCARCEELGAEPERLDAIAGGRDLDPPDGPSFPYAPRTLVDELTMAPMVVRAGEPVELEPLAPGGEVDFPEPIGAADTIYTLHSEIRTFRDSFGCRGGELPAARWRPRCSSGVRELIGASRRGDRGGGALGQPALRQDGRRCTWSRPRPTSAPCACAAVTRPMEELGPGRRHRVHRRPAAAAVRLLARGVIERRGALPPERCVRPGGPVPGAGAAELLRFETDDSRRARGR